MTGIYGVFLTSSISWLVSINNASTPPQIMPSVTPRRDLIKTLTSFHVYSMDLLGHGKSHGVIGNMNFKIVYSSINEVTNKIKGDSKHTASDGRFTLVSS